MGENKLILILLALFCGRALCTSEVGGNMCEENLVMSKGTFLAQYFQCFQYLVFR